MKKRGQSLIGKTLYIILMVGLIALIVSLGIYIYQNLPRDPIGLEVENDPQITVNNVNSNVNQFYPNMRFNHNQISYNIDISCDSEKRSRMKRALEELETNVDKISFFETPTNPDIDISCDESKQIKLDKKHFVAGEGGAKEIIQTGRFNVITEGIILLYDNSKIRTKTCAYPNVEMHELLHVFGFDHSHNKESIMYPFIESCNQVLDQSIIDQLNQIYEGENLADVYFDFLNVTKKGRYIDFLATIKNSGSIKTSHNVTLTILDGIDQIEKRDLGQLDFGAGVNLETRNLKLKRLSPDKISFILDKDDKIKELDENNNVATIDL